VYGLGACGRSAPGSGIKVSFLRWLPADWVGVGSMQAAAAGPL
jgi:hypothetical protein